jgi:hypothetical protein
MKSPIFYSHAEKFQYPIFFVDYLICKVIFFFFKGGFFSFDSAEIAENVMTYHIQFAKEKQGNF